MSLSGLQKKGRKTRGNPADPQTTETKRKRRTGIFLPHISDKRCKRKELPEFIAPHRPPDALETDLMSIPPSYTTTPNLITSYSYVTSS